MTPFSPMPGAPDTRDVCKLCMRHCDRAVPAVPIHRRQLHSMRVLIRHLTMRQQSPSISRHTRYIRNPCSSSSSQTSSSSPPYFFCGPALSCARSAAFVAAATRELRRPRGLGPTGSTLRKRDHRARPHPGWRMAKLQLLLLPAVTLWPACTAYPRHPCYLAAKRSAQPPFAHIRNRVHLNGTHFVMTRFRSSSARECDFFRASSVFSTSSG